jgi:3-isopropylmalate/(R)-2-methylmalate dehydratase small subunit
MQPFIAEHSKLIHMPFENIDTDQLMPARFMKEARKPLGYGRFLLADFGRECLINGAKILVAKRNFGCGSSREAAVYALLDSGVRCVIAPSFGDIFKNNAIKNGLLPATLDDVTPLLNYQGEVKISLETQQITFENNSISFTIEPTAKTQLLEGLDEIAMTLKLAPQIEAYYARHQELSQ